MKYIFDFDDVILDTLRLKSLVFESISQAGIPEEEVRRYYNRPENPGREFSLLGFIKRLFSDYQITGRNPEELYEEIITQCPLFLNKELIEEIKKLGKESCYIVTKGENKFQTDKIRNCGIEHLFEQIHIVPDVKGPTIKAISEENRNENMLFIDDKPSVIDEVSKMNIPKLTCALYEGEATLSELKTKGELSRNPELRLR